MANGLCCQTTPNRSLHLSPKNQDAAPQYLNWIKNNSQLHTHVEKTQKKKLYPDRLNTRMPPSYPPRNTYNVSTLPNLPGQPARSAGDSSLEVELKNSMSALSAFDTLYLYPNTLIEWLNNPPYYSPRSNPLSLSGARRRQVHIHFNSDPVQFV